MWPENVSKSDLRIDYYRGSGKGGQKRNKTASACRITHIPTGLFACAEDTRYQSKNKRLAFERLAKQLIPLMKKALNTKHEASVLERIRTYNEPQQRVTDHRLPGRVWNYADILNGSDALDDLLDALGQGDTT